MNQKQLQSGTTRKKIADAARSLFILKGYKATSIEDIVAATGSSKGNIYYHFKSKEGLFLHLMDEWDNEWEENWENNVHAYPTIADKLYGVAEQLASDDLNHPLTKVADEFFHLEEKTSEVEARMSVILNRHLLFNQKLLREGIERGEFAAGNAERLAYILEALFFGVNQMSRSIDRSMIPDLYKEAVAVFLNGVANTKPSKA